MTVFVRGANWVLKVHLQETSVNESQTLINRLASAVFENQKGSETGLAVLQIGSIKDEKKQCSKLSLLEQPAEHEHDSILVRFNQSFNEIVNIREDITNND